MMQPDIVTLGMEIFALMIVIFLALLGNGTFIPTNATFWSLK